MFILSSLYSKAAKMLDAVEMSCFCELGHEHTTSLVIALFSDVSFKRQNEQCETQLVS